MLARLPFDAIGRSKASRAHLVLPGDAERLALNLLADLLKVGKLLVDVEKLGVLGPGIVERAVQRCESGRADCRSALRPARKLEANELRTVRRRTGCVNQLQNERSPGDDALEEEEERLAVNCQHRRARAPSAGSTHLASRQEVSADDAVGRKERKVSSGTLSVTKGTLGARLEHRRLAGRLRADLASGGARESEARSKVSLVSCDRPSAQASGGRTTTICGLSSRRQDKVRCGQLLVDHGQVGEQTAEDAQVERVSTDGIERVPEGATILSANAST